MSFPWPGPFRTPAHPVVPTCSSQAAPRRANVSPSLLPFFPQPIDNPCSQAPEDRAGPGRPAHPTPALEGCFSNRTSGLPCRPPLHLRPTAALPSPSTAPEGGLGSELSTALCPSRLLPGPASAPTFTLKLLWLKSLMPALMGLCWPFTPFITRFTAAFP